MNEDYPKHVWRWTISSDRAGGEASAARRVLLSEQHEGLVVQCRQFGAEGGKIYSGVLDIFAADDRHCSLCATPVRGDQAAWDDMADWLLERHRISALGETAEAFEAEHDDPPPREAEDGDREIEGPQ